MKSGVQSLGILTLMIAVPAAAQMSIDSHGVRSGGTVIDATGVHTPGTSVDARGVHTGRVAGGRGTIVNGNGATRQVDCRGGALTVNGNNNDLRIANCRAISVAGNRNQLTIRFAGPGRISVAGNGDTVTYTAPPRTTVGISNVGTRSSVTRR